MFHVKDHKTRNLFDPYSHLGPKRRSLLEKSWAQIFRDKILPILPVHLLRKHFHGSHDRPTKELYAILGTMVIQQNEDMTDEETRLSIGIQKVKTGSSLRLTLVGRHLRTRQRAKVHSL